MTTPTPRALTDCTYFYDHFRTNHVEWAYYSIDAAIPPAHNPNLFNTDGTGTVLQQQLSDTDPLQRVIGFNTFSVAYSLNANGYGYMTTNYQGRPMGSSVVQDVTSYGTHLCLWLKGQAGSDFDVKLYSPLFEGTIDGVAVMRQAANSKWVVNIVTDNSWHHYCRSLSTLIPSDPTNPVDLTRVEHVLVSEVNPASSEQRSFSVALISFSNSLETYSVFPATVDPSTEVQTDSNGNCVDPTLQPTSHPTSEPSSDPTATAQTLTNCEYFYEDFRTNHVEWVYYSIDAAIPPANDPKLFQGTGTVLQQQLSDTDPHASMRVIGFNTYSVTYSLNANEYGYVTTNYQGRVTGSPVVKDVTSYGTHLCLWLKGQVGSNLVVSLFSALIDETVDGISFMQAAASSKWVVVIVTDNSWHHYCRSLSTLIPKDPTNPVDLTRVQHVMVSDEASPASIEQRSFSVALISFSNSSDTYSVFPATMDPYIAVELDSNGNCVDVIGPPPMAAADVPLDVLPPSDYTTILAYSYDGADTSRLAVYVHITSSKWLVLAHSLKTMGVPFFLTTDIDRALQFTTVLVYPYAPGQVAVANKLIDHMNSGNTVIFTAMASSLFAAVCGVNDFSSTSSSMSYISFLAADSGPAKSFIEDEERNIKIWDDWSSTGQSVRLYTVDSDVDVLARYKRRTNGADVMQTDVASVFSRVTDNSGTCVGLFGDIGQMASKSHTNKWGGTGRSYSSNYDPGIDMFFRLIRNIYYQRESVVTLHPIMSGKKLAITITHDCDANR